MSNEWVDEELSAANKARLGVTRLKVNNLHRHSVNVYCCSPFPNPPTIPPFQNQRLSNPKSQIPVLRHLRSTTPTNNSQLKSGNQSVVLSAVIVHIFMIGEDV